SRAIFEADTRRPARASRRVAPQNRSSCSLAKQVVEAMEVEARLTLRQFLRGIGENRGRTRGTPLEQRLGVSSHTVTASRVVTKNVSTGRDSGHQPRGGVAHGVKI